MNRPTYAEACRTFRWEDSFKALEWAPAGDVNLAHRDLGRGGLAGLTLPT